MRVGAKKMQRATVNVLEKDSIIVEEFGVIISVQAIAGDCRFVVGYPGLPNVPKTAQTGDAVLIETPGHGIVEVRLLRQGFNDADFLVTGVSPRPGLLGAFTTTDPQNTFFERAEQTKIAESIEEAKRAIHESLGLQSDQISLKNRKLDAYELLQNVWDAKIGSTMLQVH